MPTCWDTLIKELRQQVDELRKTLSNFITFHIENMNVRSIKMKSNGLILGKLVFVTVPW